MQVHPSTFFVRRNLTEKFHDIFMNIELPQAWKVEFSDFNRVRLEDSKFLQIPGTYSQSSGRTYEDIECFEVG